MCKKELSNHGPLSCSRWSGLACLVLLCILACGLLPSRALAGRWSFQNQAELEQWWRSATRLRTGESAYEVKDLSFQEGVCEARFEKGLFLPVYSGIKPVSERVVGVIFIGEGSLALRFPERADAWAFANHMVLFGGMERAALRAVAHQEAPFKARITRAMILGADPKVERLLYDLEPTSSGVVYTETPEGVDEVYVVTEGRSALGAKVVATNILPDRRRLLELDGLDPIAILREDRLLHEELGLKGEDLRVIADFQTDRSLRVASREGKTLGPQAWDRWLTCFRDGLGATNSGYKSMAFAHGVDQGNLRRFQRFSGERFAPGAEGDDAPLPRVWMAPVDAELKVEIRPANFFSNYLKARVESLLTFEARGGALRSIVMAVPAEFSIKDTWRLNKLELEDGTPIPWVALNADLWGQTLRGTKGGAAEGGQGGALEATESGADTTGGSGSMSQPVNTPDAPDLQSASDGLAETREKKLFQETARRYEIIALLPETLPEGQRVRVRMDWTANWQYANWSSEGRPLGPTTGMQPLLPELVPSPGGTGWDYKILAGLPGSGLRTYDIAVSGDTSKAWEDIDGTGWKWVEASGKGSRNVALAVGQWHDIAEQPAQGMPGVRAHLFFASEGALPQFPPEIRRVVTFLDRFLPGFPMGEVEVFQGASTFVDTALTRGFRNNAYGLIALQTIKSSEVGETSAVSKEDPNLMRTQIVQQVAGQVWGQSVGAASERDRWLLSALSDSYAAFYVRAAVGRKDYDARIKGLTRVLEDPTEWDFNFKQVNDRSRFLSLSGSTSWTELPAKVLADWGTFFLVEMLRNHVGDEIFFKTIDRLAARYAGKTLSTESFQIAMELGSGRDLSEYFDFWVHGGFIPRLELQVRQEETQGIQGAVHGCVVSDIPFGRFDVPVQVLTKDSSRVVAGPVKVQDGLGSFVIQDWKGPAELALDPDKRLLAYARKVKRLKVDQQTDCELAEKEKNR